MRFPVAVPFGVLSLTAAAAPPVMTNLNPGTRPSARTGPASTIDRSSTETFWLFGGNATLGGTNNQLWAYDVATNAWTQRTVSGATPSNRAWAALSWDVAQQRLVLFGGSSDLNGPLLNDVRLFNPATNTWTLPTVMGTAPSARFLARMLYVPHQGRHLLFGGGTATSNNAEATVLSNELWALTVNAATDTVTWQLLSPAGTPPSGRASPCVGYDPARRRLIVYGGELINMSAGDVLQYDVDANAWSTDTPPAPRPAAAARCCVPSTSAPGSCRCTAAR